MFPSLIRKIFFKFLKISILWPLTFYSDPALAYCVSKLPCAFFFSHLHLKMFFKMFLTSLMNGPFSTQLDKQCTFVMSSTRGALLAKVKKKRSKVRKSNTYARFCLRFQFNIFHNGPNSRD